MSSVCLSGTGSLSLFDHHTLLSRLLQRTFLILSHTFLEVILNHNNLLYELKPQGTIVFLEYFVLGYDS